MPLATWQMEQEPMAQPGVLEPVHRESTAALIAVQLRRAIMYGSITPGTQLSETDLAAQFGVSRGPLREATQRLVQEGLVRSERNRGLFVIVLGPDDVRDIYSARSAVERAAVSLILRRDRRTASAELDAVCAEMTTAVHKKQAARLSDADLRFHEVLVAQSGSPRLVRMHQTLLVESRMCMTALQETYHLPAEVVQEHGAIVEALRAGDETLVLRLVDAHMEDALTRLAPQA